MKLKFSKYQGAGNDFVMIDNRSNALSLNHKQIERLCDRRFGIGADGLIVIEEAEGVDFKMVYYNADGQVGSMCGNGGRCAVSFAHMLGIIHAECRFLACDGIHIANYHFDKLISLKMIDVNEIESIDGAIKMDTGSPHLVYFENNLNSIDVKKEGASIRNSSKFVKDGINVNFVEIKEDALYLRTYERGVEDETLACGTGATAAVIAAYETGLIDSKNVVVHVLGGRLEVCFEKIGSQYKEIFLTGHARFVYKGEINV